MASQSPKRTIKKYSFGGNDTENRYGVPENVLEIEVEPIIICDVYEHE
jgi:hypothetical protein